MNTALTNMDSLHWLELEAEAAATVEVYRPVTFAESEAEGETLLLRAVDISNGHAAKANTDCRMRHVSRRLNGRIT